MMRFYHMTLPLLTAVGLIACSRSTPAPVTSTAAAPVPGERLNHLVERYWDETAAANAWADPPLSPQSLADALALERRYLGDLHGVTPNTLDADSILTLDIFRRERELAIEGYTYPEELLPVNGYDSMPQRFAAKAVSAEIAAVATGKGLREWQSDAARFQNWSTQAIVNLRDGIRRGYTLPAAAVERALPVLAALGEDTPANAFVMPLRIPAEDTSDSARAPLRVALGNTVRDTILPSYRALHDFLQHDYLPHARSSVGLSALPLGDQWYAYRVKRATDATQTASQLHALGLAEVERVHKRVLALLDQTAFAGNLAGFVDNLHRGERQSTDTAPDGSTTHQALESQTAAALPSLFSVALESAEFDNIQGFRVGSAADLAYRGAHGTPPELGTVGRYLWDEAPGHRFQLALQAGRTDLPRFRRYGGSAAFISGWGLYAASLGDELGLYRDSDARFGALLAQWQCAADLVLDTGIHALGWSRLQALNFLHAHIPLGDSAADDEVDRIIALPGDALLCSVGFLEFQALRSRAQQRLGTRFDVRAFHAEVLRNGAVPLDRLDAHMSEWLEAAAKVD